MDEQSDGLMKERGVQKFCIHKRGRIMEYHVGKIQLICIRSPIQMSLANKNRERK